MPAEKKVKKSSVKKSSAKGGSKKSAAGAGSSGPGGNNTAFFVLIIVILLTIIVLMLNRFYDKGSLKLPDLKKLLPVTEESKDKKSEKDNTPADVKQESKDDEKNESKNKVEEKKKDETHSDIQKEVSIYLLKLDEKTERIYLSPVKRTVEEKDILNAALENLIKGPTPKEKDRGFITAVPAGLKVRGISINGRTAEIDFSSAIEEGAAGDILIKRVQQIVYTSTQFENINSIVIKINGQRRKSMGSDGFSISGPLKR